MLDLRKTWDLKNAEEAADAIPEIWEGKNIADFVDPEIMTKLAALEAEEEEREKSGFYDLDMEMDSDDEEIRDLAKVIRRKRKIRKLEEKVDRAPIGRAALPRKNDVRFELLGVFFLFFRLETVGGEHEGSWPGRTHGTRTRKLQGVDPPWPIDGTKANEEQRRRCYGRRWRFWICDAKQVTQPIPEPCSRTIKKPEWSQASRGLYVFLS